MRDRPEPDPRPALAVGPPAAPVRPPGAPVRDRPTWLIYACLATYGYLLYSLGPTLDALRGELDVSRARIGLASSALAVGGVLTALLARPVLARLDHVAALRAALLALAAGAVSLLAAGSPAVVIAGCLMVGVGGTLVLLVIPVAVEERQRTARAAIIAEANLGASVAGVLAPVAIGAGTILGAGWRPGLALVLAPLLVLVVAVGSLGRAGAPPQGDVTMPDVAPGRLPRGYWRWWALLVLAVAIEFCMFLWAADFLRREAGVSRGVAALGVGLFVGGMAAGRLVGARLAVTRLPNGLLMGALAVAVAGFTLFWAGGGAATGLLGLAVTGTGVAMLYPLSLTLAMGAAPGRSVLASGRASLGAGLAVLIAPFALAALADTVGLRPAFLLVYGLLAAAAMLARDG